MIETLVALAIMSIAMSAFYTTMSMSYGAAAKVKEHQAALESARSHLDLIGRAFPIGPGEYTGVYENGLKWQLTIEPLLPDPSRPSTAAQPFLISLTTFSRRDVPLLQLETIKIGVEPSS